MHHQAGSRGPSRCRGTYHVRGKHDVGVNAGHRGIGVGSGTFCRGCHQHAVAVDLEASDGRACVGGLDPVQLHRWCRRRSGVHAGRHHRRILDEVGSRLCNGRSRRYQDTANGLRCDDAVAVGRAQHHRGIGKGQRRTSGCGANLGPGHAVIGRTLHRIAGCRGRAGNPGHGHRARRYNRRGSKCRRGKHCRHRHCYRCGHRLVNRPVGCNHLIGISVRSNRRRIDEGGSRYRAGQDSKDAGSVRAVGIERGLQASGHGIGCDRSRCRCRPCQCD